MAKRFTTRDPLPTGPMGQDETMTMSTGELEIELEKYFHTIFVQNRSKKENLR
jgi:hypothetical protein